MVYFSLSKIVEIHFDTTKANGILKLRSHPNLSNTEIMIQLSKIFKLLELDLEKFQTKVQESLKTTFHDLHYEGNVSEIEEPTGYPQLIKLILDDTLKELFQNGCGTVNNSEYMVLLGLRLDHIFSNKRVEISWESKNYDNDYYHDGFWPTQPIKQWPEHQYPFTRKHPVKRLYNTLLDNLYNGQTDKNRTELYMDECEKKFSHVQLAELWLKDPCHTDYSTKMIKTSLLLNSQ